MPTDANAYETTREANIARNEARMRELGVDAAARAATAPPKRRKMTTTSTSTSSPPPRRTSSRARTAPVTYSDDAYDAFIDKASASARPSRAYEPTTPPESRVKSARLLPEATLPDGARRHPTKGHLVFKDRPDFTPNLTPAQVIRAGTWGGCYFHPRGGKPGIRGPCDIDANEFPREWFEGLAPREYRNRRYACETNMYGVKAGQTQQYWEENGWIDARDPRGWFHWYCRFYLGRRLKDGEDDRQISRWKGVCGDKGRWKRNLINKIIDRNARFDDSIVSPVVRQTLLHWAYEVTPEDVTRVSKTRR